MQSIVKCLGTDQLPLHRWHHLMAQQKETKGCAILDSSLKNSLGQFSILGAFPYTVLEDREGKLYENDEEKAGTFIDRLKEFLKENQAENPTKKQAKNQNPKQINYNASQISFTKGGSSAKTDEPPLTSTALLTADENPESNGLSASSASSDSVLPLTAGGIIYLTYDYGRGFENIKSQHRQLVKMPSARAAFYDLLLIQRESDGCLYLCTQERLHDTNWYLDFLNQLSQSYMRERVDKNNKDAKCTASVEKNKYSERTIKNSTFANNTAQITVSSDFTRDDYYQAIQRMMDYMEAGDIYVANMTRQILVKSQADPLSVFEILREKNPSPFGGYFDLGDAQIICASPERFLKVTDGHVKTRPIKGTRKRGATPEEDAFFRNELENSDKDKSELLMIVDLERNDLNRICIPGTVKVPEMFSIEEYATVFHLVSEIHGRLPEGKNAADLLKETFPGGSITGTPKIRAMEIIDELEHSARGLYTGSLGYISFDGDCDLNIVIRTAVHQDGVFHIGAGGGITYESDVEFEYEETNQKAHAVVEAIRSAT